MPENPLFRKVILPWYDTEVICILTGVLMILVAVFSIIGIYVALEIPESSAYLWVPALLLILSTVVIVTTALRLFRRHAHRFKKELP